MAKEERRRRRLVLGARVLLVLSLALNLAALFLPFLEVDPALRGKELYSLPRSVLLLWEARLRLFALLVAVFSIAFPFVKLATLLQAAAVAGSRTAPPEARRRALGRAQRAGRLGRWSALDVFLAALLLGLTNERFFVETEARIGLPLFSLAILLSLAAGELVEHALDAGQLPAREPARAPAPAKPRARLGAGLLVAGTWIALALALALPFLAIDDWRLRDDSYSLLGLAGELHRASWPVGAFVLFFAVLLPVLELLLLSLAARPGAPGAARAMAHRARLARWSMLEVFLLALAIFLLEGRAFVRTELRSGTLLLCAALALHLLARSLLAARLARAIAPTAPVRPDPLQPAP